MKKYFKHLDAYTALAFLALLPFAIWEHEVALSLAYVACVMGYARLAAYQALRGEP